MDLATFKDLPPLSALGTASPLITIVVPTYNHLDLLKACLGSVAEYTDLSFSEVIVVANGCTDGTIEYLRTLPPPFRTVLAASPLGFTRAANMGIQAARGEYVILLNNDTVILPQKKNLWVEMLHAPFFLDPMVGVTGPAKFTWDCGGVERRAIAFWCAMIPKKLFSKTGLLDEIFSPGMGEDGDFCIKAEEAGYKLVAVPENNEAEFGKGIPQKNFPIFHKGSGTFGDKDYSAVYDRNAQILRDRYGKKDRLEEIYRICLNHPCDLDKLFPTFRRYAEKCKHITEFGVRGVFSSYAFLAARPKRMVSYDIEYSGNIEEAKTEAKKAGIDFEFRQEDVLQATIEPTELLFIDTVHCYAQTKAELERHAVAVSKYILIHDTETYGQKGDDGGPGEIQAIDEFLARHSEWARKEVLSISNGLTVLERLWESDSATVRKVSGTASVKTSIIIPTCGKDWENVLKKCLDAVFEYTDLSDKEVIVVANGCPTEAIDHLRASSAWVRTINFPDRLGYIGAVNRGIDLASGEFVVLLDDDSILQPHGRDAWIEMLLGPLKRDPEVAAAGPFSTTYEDLGQVLHSGCTMYRRNTLIEIGKFDPAYDPGYLGDEDVSFRLRKAGHRIVEVPEGQTRRYVNGTFEIGFPVVHTGTVNTMPKHTSDLPLVERNRNLLYERHGASTWPNAQDPGARVTVTPAAPATPYRYKKSIVIPTYEHLNDLLIPNLESLRKYTDLSDLEVVVVANGCTDGTEDYVRSLGEPFKVISFKDALGFTKATNEGLKIAQGEFVILYNNDNMLLDQPKNRWMNQLLEPFKDNPKMGVTGPLQLHDDYADQDVIIGFCLCIRRSVMEEAMADTGGLLDEIFSPGGGEDIDLCCKVRGKGYIVRQVPKEGKLGFSHTNEGDFMIWHRNNQTFKDIPDYTRWYVKRNGLINCKRYNKNIRLNLGSGGMEYPGYLSVDLYDHRATIIQDITKLDFDENSVQEMIAIHVLEHLSPYVVLDTLKLWHKILKHGGKLVMELPDMENLCRKFLTANTGERYGILNAIYGTVNTSDSGDPTEISSPHLYGWHQQSIADHLWNAGFLDISFGEEKYPHPEPPNMHVEARKP